MTKASTEDGQSGQAGRVPAMLDLERQQEAEWDRQLQIANREIPPTVQGYSAAMAVAEVTAELEPLDKDPLDEADEESFPASDPPELVPPDREFE